MTEETKRPDRSEAINELAAALAKAQGAFEAVPKSRKNPLFHSEYATLDDIISATRKGLSANGLAVMQTTEGNHLVTTLAHASGQWQSTTIAIMVGEIRNREGQAVLTSAQAYGSAITYARRYSLAALLCVAADEDDDGNTAGEQGKPRKPEAKTAQDAPTAPKPPGAAQTTGAGEKAAPVCDSCGKSMTERTRKDGSGKFWSCGTKLSDGTWCKGKPVKVEAKTAPLPLADAPPETSNEQFDKLASASYADGGTPPLATPTQRKYILDMAARKGQPVPPNIETMRPAEANAVIEQWRVIKDMA